MWDLDEVCLSRGELYTVLINKERKGRSGSLIAVVKGTDVKTVTSVLLRLFHTQTLSGQGDNHGYGSEHGAERPPLFSRRTPRHHTISMCRNSLMRRFRICALKHVGRLWTRNWFGSTMPKPAGRASHCRSLKTVIHANSFFKEAFTCYIRRNPYEDGITARTRRHPVSGSVRY